jgi:antitoxin component of MazEF toxin-antitoxin module
LTARAGAPTIPETDRPITRVDANEQLTAVPSFRFTARIRRWGPDGAYVEIPASASAALGAGDRLAVVARIRGVEVRKSMAPRAGGVYRMSIDRAVREQTGLRPGDEVAVELERADG